MILKPQGLPERQPADECQSPCPANTRQFPTGGFWPWARNPGIAAMALCGGLLCGISSVSIGAAPAAATALPAAGPTPPKLPMGFTAEGYPYRGAAEAPITLEEYSDYLCPFSAKHFRDTQPGLLEKYGPSGQMKFVYRDFPLTSPHPTAAAGHQAALCVAEQGAPLFWAMHDELFLRQAEWRQQSDPTLAFKHMAKQVGANLAKFSSCLKNGRKKVFLESSIAAGNALGFNGTPSFRFLAKGKTEPYTLSGALPQATFAEWTDALLAGREPPKLAEAPKPELPAWAKPEGLRPDSQRPGYTVAGDEYKGSPDAPLTVIEFSDFQCPACRRHALETQPRLDERFVSTGKVRWIFKHRPLREHDRSASAAAAAECAAEQGRFWDMHHALFENQEQWIHGEAVAGLAAQAERLQLDRTRFDRCLDSRSATAAVLQDVLDAPAAAQNTPTFIVIGQQGGGAGVMSGVKTPEEFGAVLDKQLQAPALIQGDSHEEPAKKAPPRDSAS